MDLRSRVVVVCALLVMGGCVHEGNDGRVPTPGKPALNAESASPRSHEEAEVASQPAQPTDALAAPSAAPVLPEPSAPPVPALAAPASESKGEPAKDDARASEKPKKQRMDAAQGLGQLGVSGVGRGGGGRGYGVGAVGYGKSVGPSALVAEQPEQDFNREGYAHVAESDFINVHDQALSTFSIDVDTASYSNVRRFIRDGRLPPADAVRIEELVNYFDYDYPEPTGQEPFSVYAEVSDCPWNGAHRLVHLGIQGKHMDDRNVPARNLVFLLDVSGSMQDPDKLPLLKSGLSLLAQNLRPEDHVSIVVYAGASGLVLPATSGTHANRVIEALDRLDAGGSTNGAAGIELAYAEAQKNFIKGGINRVILATDGDFNVGVTSEGELVRLIEQKRESGVFLTVLGFGTGNVQDSRMEQLADKGNGNYAYIDTLDEANKVLVREAGSTLVTIAKDVKLQVEFNPALVASYRLVGYENRALAARDFNDDKKDAGEIGAGHSVTALYEIVPAGADEQAADVMVDPLRYQAQHETARAQASGELMTVKVRYKGPSASTSELISLPLRDQHRALRDASSTFRFSAAVAGFGMVLRASKHKGSATLPALQKLAESALGNDPHGEKGELLDMMRAAQRLGQGS
jgi:Ca-activated chloride channel family protein